LTTRDRLLALGVGAALIFALVTARPPQIVGDGGEYLVYSLNFVSLHGPSLRTRDLESLKRQARDYAPHLEDETFYRNAVTGRGGRRDFMHFWFMALVAAPFVALAKIAGLPPIVGYVGMNVTLLLAALWVALPRIGVPASLFLFGSPIIWWFDKAHPEVFTFTLLAICVLLVRDKPWWSMIAAGAASTQYPHVAVLVGVIAVASVAFHRPWLADRRFRLGLIAGGVLSILHPAYYYVRHGTPSLLLQVANTGAPTAAELSTVLFDLEVGLLASFPMLPIVLAVAVALAIRRGWRTLVTVDVVVAAVATLFFLYVFGTKDNVHHGATPSLSRYALWFIPLAMPLLKSDLLRGDGWRRFAWTAALVSAPVSAFAFHPTIPDHGREPTWAASYVWRHHPTWSSPLPEIFVGTLGRTEDLDVPVTTNGCEKILTGGPGVDGTWPVPCFPAPVPVPCSAKNVWCYANRTPRGYVFRRAPGRWNGVPLVVNTTWPREAEAPVRKFMTEWEWWRLRQNVEAPAALAAKSGVEVTALEGDDRFILVLRDPIAGASVTLRLRESMNGVLVDARTGATIQALQYSGPAGEPWEVPIPSEPNLSLLAMRR
jgi:hypothetical protein